MLKAVSVESRRNVSFAGVDIPIGMVVMDWVTRAKFLPCKGESMSK